MGQSILVLLAVYCSVDFFTIIHFLHNSSSQACIAGSDLLCRNCIIWPHIYRLGVITLLCVFLRVIDRPPPAVGIYQSICVAYESIVPVFSGVLVAPTAFAGLGEA